MTAVPSAVLSERLQDAIRNRRLVSAVFLTYQLDPAFFEQEVIPLLVDVPLAHAPAIRLVQLEDALRDLAGEIAVYFDANGLAVSDEGSAKLDVRRIPVRLASGIFHAKNVFALVEQDADDPEQARTRSLIVVSLSANLTRAGWWENVEVAHVEEIAEGDRTRLRDDLIYFLEGIKRRAAAVAAGQRAVDDVLAFLRRETEQRAQRSSGEELHTHFYAGREPIADFIERVAGDRVRGACLEVLSPYLDDAAESKPLQELVDRFAPREVRVLLPRSSDGTARCNEAMYGWIRSLLNSGWGRLSGELARRGKGDDAQPRFIHAKVYRFFSRNPSREILFVGSANLTRPAHQRGGNLESGVLVELRSRGRPEFWLEPDQRRPLSFEVTSEDEGAASSAGSRLSLRYRWDAKAAEGHWDDPNPAPILQLNSRGIDLGTLEGLPARQWTVLSQALSEKLGRLLSETSLVQVIGDRPDTIWLLVQEEAMLHKPSLLLQLTVAEILRYWALLTAEQRAAFIEQRFPDLSATATGRDLLARLPPLKTVDSFFDRFAGIFHSFGCLERSVRDALAQDREKDAAYRLFGQKYDSLPTLLAQLAEEGSGNDIDRYVMVLSARQMCEELKRAFPDFWDRHQADAASIGSQLSVLDQIRQRLVDHDPSAMAPFLQWFDRWFLKRAQPEEVAGA